MTQAVLLAGVLSISGSSPVKADGQGAYTGSIEVSGTRVGPEVTYRASMKVTLPISDRSDRSKTAEFFAGEAPDVTVLISQWDESFTEKFADSDGKFTSWKCSLAEPATIQMTPTGVLYADLGARDYTLSISLLSTTGLKLACSNSRSGAYEKEEGILLYVGTSFPGGQAPLRFTDAAHLEAEYTLVPTSEMAGEYGSIVQSWNLRLES